jgi:hypothetical protein
MTDDSAPDPRRHAIREALDGLWLTETATGFAVGLDDMLARLDKAGLTAVEPSRADNELEYSDNFRVHGLPDGEIRQACRCCGLILTSTVDLPDGGVSLASLIEAAEDHEDSGCSR